MKKSFKEKTLFDKRIQESEQIRNKYPDRIPIIVEKYKDCKLPDVDKCKYLVPNDMTMSKFIFVVRRRIELDSSQALFITINGIMAPASQTVGELYDNQKDEDGFLYVVYTSENTFG
tara:strand:- start:1798 stop:2148 length:351 start_codon:yes stop_codon:yes gene_type:complete